MTERLVEFNVADLLKPISEEKVCGNSLRYSDVYDKIRAARREDDEKLPQGIWKAELKKADWTQVDQLCVEALKNRSKDLQIAAWLTEARLRLEGIEGLAQGLELILELIRTYWEGLFPQMDGGGLKLRIALFDWINMRLSEETHCVPVSIPPEKTAQSYSLLDLNEANRLEISAKRNSASGRSSLPEGKQSSLSKISSSISQTPTAYYRYIDKSCVLALKVISELEEELRLRLGEGVSSFYRLKEKVETVQRFATHILETRGEKKEGKKTISTETDPPIPPKKRIINPIENRDHAYAILAEVATYLERIEPHSPTPYLIHRAISWGGMNLSQVVSNVLNEDGNISLLLDLLNVRKEQS